MSNSTGSMGPFLEGYRQEAQKSWSQERRPYMRQATDILDLFADMGVESMTIPELSSHLLVPWAATKMLVNELVERKLLSIMKGKEGESAAVLTKRGKLYIGD